MKIKYNWSGGVPLPVKMALKSSHYHNNLYENIEKKKELSKNR